MLVPWTALRRSEHARRWRLTGIGISLASSVALLAAAVVSTPFGVGLALLAGITGVVAWIAARERINVQFEIGVSSGGQIMVREYDLPVSAGSAPERPLQVSFASPWLISLRRGTMLIPVWPDSLPRSVFRQLWVHLRWAKAVPKNDKQLGPVHPKT